MKSYDKLYKDPQKKQVKVVVLFAAGLILLMMLVGVLTFSLVIRGPELTMVPNVTEMDVLDAIMALQKKELIPIVELRYSANPADKGKVLGQDPKSGSQLRAGKKVVLRISRGGIIERVENYIGWKLSDLEIHLKSLFTATGPLISIQQPVVRVFNTAPSGTILEQKPEPESPLSGPVQLQLIVSKGQEGEIKKVENYVGMTIEKAILSMAGEDLPFIFAFRKAEKQEKPGTVVSQTPAPGETVTEDTRAELVVAEPKNLPRGQIFGIMEKSLPEYPVLVDLKVEAILPDGDREERFSMRHPGGAISFAYIEEENTVLVLYVFDKEILRYTVK